MQLPAIDQNVCGQWTQADKDYYNKLDVYLVKFVSDYRKRWAKWSNAFPRKIKWTSGQGNTMRRVAQEWSPVIRQESHPSLLAEVPTADVNFTRERTLDVQLYRHRFMTREFWFLPEFQDFFQHLEHEFEDLQKQITAYEDFFIRTRVFHHSPYVYICGVGLVNAPTGVPNSSGTAGKTDAWLSQVFEGALGGAVTPLTLNELFKIGGIVRNRIGMTPYSGSDSPKMDKGVDASWKLLMDDEVFYSFTNDAWVKNQKTDNFDVVNGLFEGKAFGRISSDFERYPLRWKYDAATVTRPNPETVLEGDTAEEKYRTAPNPDYALNAQYGCAFWMGGNSYSVVDSGPPPAIFGKTLDGMRGMNWNGKPTWTRKFLVKCKDSNGDAQDELAETWGEHMRAQAQQTYAIAPDNAFNVLPIIYQRPVLGLTTT